HERRNLVSFFLRALPRQPSARVLRPRGHADPAAGAQTRKMKRVMRLNPFARVETTRGASGQIDGLRIVAPVKRRGLRTTWMEGARNPSGFARARRAVLTALLDAEQGRDAWRAADAFGRVILIRTGLFVEGDECPSEVAPPFLCSTSEYLTPD